MPRLPIVLGKGQTIHLTNRDLSLYQIPLPKWMFSTQELDPDEVTNLCQTLFQDPGENLKFKKTVGYTKKRGRLKKTHPCENFCYVCGQTALLEINRKELKANYYQFSFAYASGEGVSLPGDTLVVEATLTNDTSIVRIRDFITGRTFLYLCRCHTVLCILNIFFSRNDRCNFLAIRRFQ